MKPGRAKKIQGHRHSHTRLFKRGQERSHLLVKVSEDFLDVGVDLGHVGVAYRRLANVRHDLILEHFLVILSRHELLEGIHELPMKSSSAGAGDWECGEVSGWGVTRLSTECSTLKVCA